MNLILLLRTSRTAQVIAGTGALIIAFLIWLHFHDRGVIKRENEVLNERALEMANEAAENANLNQAEREEIFNASQDALRNATDPHDYLVRLRAAQDRERTKAASR